MATVVTGVADKETRSSRPAEEKHSAHSNSTVEIEYTSQVQQEPAEGQGPEGSCNGEAENAERDMAIVNYCIQLAAEEDAEKAAVEDWDEVLGAVEMAQKTELAEIKWTADAEVNKWMAAVKTAVEVSRGTVQEKVEKIEMRDFRADVKIKAQVKICEESGQVA